MGLLEHHGVEVLSSIVGAPSRLFFGEAPQAPTLESLVAKGHPQTGKDFPGADLIPARVGVSVSAAEKGMVDIECFPVSWAAYSVMADADSREQLPLLERFYCLAVSCLVRTSDGMYVLSLRSKKVSHYKDMLHVSAAGYVDFQRAHASQSLLPQVFCELEEELLLLPSQIDGVRQLGVCRHLPANSAVVEGCFAVTTPLTAAEVLERSQHAKDSWEGKIHIFSAAEVQGKLKTEPFNPAGAATAVLALGL